MEEKSWYPDTLETWNNKKRRIFEQKSNMSFQEGSKWQEEIEDLRRKVEDTMEKKISAASEKFQKATLSFGEKAAGVSFNPSKDPFVDHVKGLYAKIIDNLNDARHKAESQEAKRYFSKAISYTEDAQMNAVKAITWQY